MGGGLTDGSHHHGAAVAVGGGGFAADRVLADVCAVKPAGNSRGGRGQRCRHFRHGRWFGWATVQ